jgi:acetyltransferase
MNLDKIFKPKKIAIIGASSDSGSVGYALFHNLINSDFKGTVTPVNTKRKKVQGIKAYKKISDIGEAQDLAVIITPAKTVSAILTECGEAGVGGVIIISSGFSETGKNGEKLSTELKNIAKKYNIRILGPNCLGYICPTQKLNVSFAGNTAKKGNIAFISQSGALCTSILDWANKNNVGFSYFVSIGEMADISFHDLIDYFGSDPNTTSILIYMETLKDARKFISAARAFSKNKPIVVLKSGRSEEGAKATKSHTGSLAGNDKVFSAAFARAGVIRVDTVVGLFHVAKTLAMQSVSNNNKLAILTNAGGPGVIATDALIYSGGKLTTISPKTIKELDKVLPMSWSHNNPIDIIGDADATRYEQALRICLLDDNIDAILVILTPQAMTDPAQVARRIVEVAKKSSKTILASWMGGNSVAQGRRILEAGNIPTYRAPEDAINAFLNTYKYARNLQILNETPSTIPHAFTPKTEENKNLLKRVADEGRYSLNETEAKELLANYEIPVVQNAIAKNALEAGEKATEIGFPVVMKILSPDIIHKVDVGGVVLNVNSKSEAELNFEKIINSARTHFPDAQIDGIFIEGMINKKYELLIGSKKDPIFGPVIVFGMGGVAVEIFKDIKVGLPPLNMSLAMRLIEGTKVYKLLQGYRNMPGVDIQSIQFLLYKFAYLIADFPEISEIDINPFAIDEYGGIVLDAKVILDKQVVGKDIKPYSHLVISPYPKEYIFNLKTKKGKEITIRPIKPEDEPMEDLMFASILASPHEHIFFDRIKNITHELLERYSQIDYDREMVLVAEAYRGKNKEMVGLARLVEDPNSDSAEFSFVVPDSWQGNGIGGLLVDRILEIARDKNFERVYAKFLAHNDPATMIFTKRGFKISQKGEIAYADLKI